jgi:hypothetical protein
MSETAKTINSIGASVGGLAALGGGTAAGLSLFGDTAEGAAKEAAGEVTEKAVEEGAKEGAEKATTEVAKDATKESINGPGGKGPSQAQTMACVSAAAFAISAGVSIHATLTLKQEARKECQKINKLAGTQKALDGKLAANPPRTDAGGVDISSPTAPGSGTGTPSPTGSAVPGAGANNQLAVAGNSPVAGQVAGAGAGTSGTPGVAELIADYQTCLQNASAAECKRAELANLKNSKIGSALDRIGRRGQGLNIPDPAALLGALDSEGAGGAIASLMPASLGDNGLQIAKLADAAQKEGALIRSAVAEWSGMGAIPIASGGGASGGSSGGGSLGAQGTLASLFGGGSKAGGPSLGQDTTQFGGGRQPASSDIWHHGTGLSLFQIVSGKITTVAPRLTP